MLFYDCHDWRTVGRAERKVGRAWRKIDHPFRTVDSPLCKVNRHFSKTTVKLAFMAFLVFIYPFKSYAILG